MKRRLNNNVENAMTRSLDSLLVFDDFEATILPKLRKAIKEGQSAEQMYRTFESHIAARMLTTALSDPDSGKAMVASKEILDRSLGKAREKIDHTHKYAKLSDQELDSLLRSVEEIENDDKG